MRIGELAARAGVHVRSLRYYEEQGLLAPVRTAGGQRQFTETDVERVAFVQRLYAAGLTSRTIRELLPCLDSPSADHSEAALQRLVTERARLSAHIEDLLRTRETLDALTVRTRRHREERDLVARPTLEGSGSERDA